MQDINNPLFFEQIVIKSLFTKEVIRDTALPYLNPELFTDANVQILVKEIVKFHNEFNKFPKPHDLFLNLKSEEAKNKLREIGNIDSKQFLEENLVKNIEKFFANQLTHEALAEATEHLVNGNLDKIDPQKLLEAKTFSFNNSIGIDVFEDDGEKFFHELHEDAQVIPTGLKRFDEMLCGGFRRKALTLFICKVNGGKTRAKCALTKNLLYTNNNVLFIPLEGTKESIKHRILYNFLNASRDELKKLSVSELKDSFTKIKNALKNRLIIEEYPEHELNANKLKLLLKNLKEKKRFVPDVIFIDYMGLVSPNVISKDGGNQAFNLKRASEEFHAIAKEFDMAMVSSMQFNREGAGSSSPEMEDISESFATLFTADEVVLLIQTEEMIKDKRQLWKKVKTRTGNKGMTGYWNIDDPKQRLYELELGQMSEEEKKKINETIAKETQDIQSVLKNTDEKNFTRNFEFE